MDTVFVCFEDTNVGPLVESFGPGAERFWVPGLTFDHYPPGVTTCGKTSLFKL